MSLVLQSNDISFHAYWRGQKWYDFSRLTSQYPSENAVKIQCYSCLYKFDLVNRHWKPSWQSRILESVCDRKVNVRTHGCLDKLIFISQLMVVQAVLKTLQIDDLTIIENDEFVSIVSLEVGSSYKIEMFCSIPVCNQSKRPARSWQHFPKPISQLKRNPIFLSHAGTNVQTSISALLHLSLDPEYVISVWTGWCYRRIMVAPSDSDNAFISMLTTSTRIWFHCVICLARKRICKLHIEPESGPNHLTSA